MAVQAEDKFIGARLKLRRTQLGVSQQVLGKIENLTFQQIQKYESGTNRISAGRLYRFAKILNIDIQYFFDGLDDVNNLNGNINSNINGNINGDINSDALSDSRLVQSEMKKLNKYYLAIKNVGLKKAVVMLAKQLAESESSSQGTVASGQWPEVRKIDN